MGPAQAGQVDIEHGVAIQEQELAGESVQACQHSPGRSERFLFDLIADAQPPTGAIAQHPLNQRGAVARENQDLLEPVMAGQLELVFQQRLARDRNEGLGQFAQPLLEPRAFAAG